MKRHADRDAVLGHVDGFLGEGLYGWACMPHAPEERLWVELLVDDCPVGIARAENPHPDAAAYGDGCYGFWLPLPPVLRDASGTARVRVANLHQTLDPPVALSPAKESAPRGAVASDMGLTLSGWLHDPAEPERVLHVSAWLTDDRGEDEKLAEAPANERRFRPETADGHGFSLTLPLKLADGLPHIVQVRDEEKRPVPGSPVLVCALPQGVAHWLGTQKKLEAPQRRLLSTFLTHYEAWLPKGVRLEQFPAWHACFPVPEAPTPRGLGVALADVRIATREALRQTAADHAYVLLHRGETLHPHAVGHLLRALADPDATLAFADGVLRQASGVLPLCRPAWDIYRFLCEDGLGPCLVRARLLRELPHTQSQTGAADAATNAAGTAGASLRTQCILAAHAGNGIRHVPLFLSETDADDPLPDAAGHRRAVRDWLRRTSAGITVEQTAGPTPRLNWSLPRTPLVSLLIPTRDRADLLRACLASLQRSTYEAVEVLLLDNDSQEQATRALFRRATQQALCRFPVRVLPWAGAFNYAAINNFGAGEARGDILCLLNNDTEVVSPDWLQTMLGPLLAPPDGSPAVGAVGAKLLWPNQLVQHGGVVVGTHQLAAHIGNTWTADEPGYMRLNQLTRQTAAVTAACLLTPRQLFLELGGLDAVRFPVAFNDVDYCLRLRAAGKAVVWTPHATLMHHESASRGHDVTPPQKARSDMEKQHFRSLWGHYEDPFYNPNLSLSTVLEPFAGLALPPRRRSTRS